MSTLFTNRGHFYAPHVRPVLIDCNFVVDSTNGNGLGIRSLKGQGVANIFMNTSQPPGRGTNGYLNPNPAAGNILVQLSDNYNRSYGGSASFIPKLSGPPIVITAANLTVGTLYVIVSLGTSTAADWLAVGVPPGVTPAVGVAFVATSTGAGAGTGAVEVPFAAGAGIDHIETIGNPNLSLFPIPVGGSPNVGGWIALACMNANTLTAPPDGTVIALEFYLGQSSVAVAGE